MRRIDERRGGVADAGFGRRQQTPQLVEQFHLRTVLRMLGLVGAREMRDHVFELDAFEQVAPTGQHAHVGGAESEPRHARVDVQQRAAVPTPALDLLERGQHGRRAQRDELVDGREHGAFEHVDRNVGRQRAQLGHFGQRRNEELTTALAQQPAGHAHRAEPVAVRFHHGRALGRRGLLAQQPVVPCQRVQVYTQKRGGGCFNLHTAAALL